MRASHVIKSHSPIFQGIGGKQPQSFPLLFGSPGEKVRIVSFGGGGKMAQRLIGMGLNVGSEVTIIRKGAPGPCVIAIGDVRIAVGAGMAHKIMVSPVLAVHSNGDKTLHQRERGGESWF